MGVGLAGFPAQMKVFTQRVAHKVELRLPQMRVPLVLLPNAGRKGIGVYERRAPAAMTVLR